MGEVASHRLHWWLRAERAFGLNFVHLGSDVTPFGINVDAADDAEEQDEQVAQPANVAVMLVEELAAVASRGGSYGEAALGEISVGESAPREPDSAPTRAAASAAVAGTVALPILSDLMSEQGFASPPLSPEEKLVALRSLDADEVRGCVRCGLGHTRRNTVFGEGSADARLVFVGEGPGATEDQTGRPFVGRAGQKLDEMIMAMGLTRGDVYICNVVKCRAFVQQPMPKDRPPLPEEAAACIPYLHRQLEIIRPTVLVTLGLSAAQHLLGVKLSMSRMRGNWYAWRGIPVMPTFHPSYILRNYTQETRRAVWSDLRQVIAKLAESDATSAMPVS